MRGADMRAKALALPFHIVDRAAFETVVVEARLADCDHLRVLRQLDELSDARLAHIFMVRMHADRRVDIVVPRGDIEHRRQRFEIDRDAQRVRDRVLAHLVEHLRQAVGKSFEIDMAV